MIDALGGIASAVSAAFSESLPYVSAFAALASAAVAWAVYRDQSSPDVVVYVSQVSAGSSVVGLFIENIGKAPAYDLAFEVEGDLPMSDGTRDDVSTFLGHGISLLMPGARRGAFLGGAHELLSAKKDAEAAVSVAFARRRGGRRVRVFVASKMLTKRHVAFEHFGRHVLHCFFALPSIKAASMRWLAPLNSTSLPWWTILSIMADASLSSPRTVPHFENSMFVVNIMLRLS